jgi:hypothetical protein
MKPTLLVLAAGMGSRYGSLKQLDTFGPSGETIIEYSIYDAIRAGFGKVVFIIRESFEQEFKAHFGRKFEDKIAVDYVYQELHKLPAGISYNPERTKPWGTTHAVWVAASQVHEPFAVINGDDFYGAQSFQIVADFLRNATDLNASRYCLIGFKLPQTLSENGSVSRGVCAVDNQGNLLSVDERTKIYRRTDGQIVYEDADGTAHSLSGNETVSMNFWGFTPSVFRHCEEYFTRFLAQHSQDLKAESYLPILMDTLVKDGKAQIEVIPSPEPWFGVTYKEDKPVVTEKINALVKSGVYPANLWA